MTDNSRDLLAEIDATLLLGWRHLDFAEQAFDLLVRLRPLVERETKRPGQEFSEARLIRHPNGEALFL